MWALVGTSTSIFLGIREDLGLPASGLISFLLILWQQRMEKKANLPFTAKANNLSLQNAK